MSIFRVFSVDLYPYSEATLHENLKEMTLHLSGNESVPSIALNFTLEPVATAEKSVGKAFEFTGRFVSQKNEDIEFKFAVPAHSEQIEAEGHEIRAKKLGKSFRVTQTLKKSAWIFQNQLSADLQGRSFKILELNFDEEDGSLIGGVGQIDRDGQIVDLKALEAPAENNKISSDSRANPYHDETEIAFALVSKDEQTLGKFVGFYGQTSLHCHLIGIFSDKLTNSEIKVVFHLSQSSFLTFNYSTDGAGRDLVNPKQKAEHSDD